MSKQQDTEIELQTTDDIKTNTAGSVPSNSHLGRKPSAIGFRQYDENNDHAIVFHHVNYFITKYGLKWADLNTEAERPSCFVTIKQILRDVSGFIPKNCVCGIVGQSGAGKTTLLGLLAGIPKSGDKSGNISVSSKKIVFVSQHPHLPDTETVNEILKFATSVTYEGPINDEIDLIKDDTFISKWSNRWKVINHRITRVLQILNLSKVRYSQIRYLSGGERKRVSIAMQLVTNPDILVLDEPTSGLDTPNALSLVQTLRHIVQTVNCTVVMSIHQPHKRICDCIDWMLALKDGILMYQGTLPQAIVCRDVILNKILSTIQNSKSDADVDDNGSMSKDGLQITTKPSSNDDNNDNDDDETQSLQEKKSDVNIVYTDNRDNDMDVAVSDEYFPNEIIKTLESMYNLDIFDNDKQINEYVLSSLFNDIMKTGSLTQNAADYLLETEYLTTTTVLNEHWLQYREKKYINPSFTKKVEDSVDKNISLESEFCGWDINSFIGCNFSDWLLDFGLLSTYMHASWAFYGLFLRTTRYYLRKFWIVAFNVLISIAAAVVLGSIYGELTTKQSDVQNRFGAFGFMCIFLGIQAVASSGTFHEVREVFIDDRNAKLYGAIPFLFARSLPDLLLLRVLPSLCFGVIFFNMLGFQEHTYGDFIGVVLLLALASSVCVFAISSLMPDAYIAGFVAIFVNMLFMLYGGVFIQDDSVIPDWIAWPKQMSFYNFAFEILMVNEFTGLVFVIDDTTVTVNGKDIQTDGLEVTLTGEFFLEFFGMDPDDVDDDWTMLVVWICVYFVIAYLSLELLYRSKR